MVGQIMNPTSPTPLPPHFRRVRDAGFGRITFRIRQRRMDFTPPTVLFETDGEAS